MISELSIAIIVVNMILGVLIPIVLLFISKRNTGPASKVFRPVVQLCFCLQWCWSSLFTVWS